MNINLLNNLHKSEEISTDNLNKFKEKLEKVKVMKKIVD